MVQSAKQTHAPDMCFVWESQDDTESPWNRSQKECLEQFVWVSGGRPSPSGKYASCDVTTVDPSWLVYESCVPRNWKPSNLLSFMKKVKNG